MIHALKPLRPVQGFPADTFRLSINFLSDDDWHTTNHPGVAGRLFSFTSLEGLRGDQTILPELSFAKAQVVLSDSTALGDTNACLSPFEEVEIGDIFILSGDSELSEEKLELIRQEITERFDILHSKAGANAFTPTVTSDFEHAFAYHQQLFDSFILGRSFLDDTAPDQLQGFNTSTVRMESCVYGARAWGGTPWPAVTWDAPPVLADESRISGHFGTITYSGFAAISAGNTTETTSAASFVALVDITEEISHQPLITEAAVNTTTSTSQGLPSRSTLVTSTMSYAGLSAFGSENRRYTSASVYTAAKPSRRQRLASHRDGQLPIPGKHGQPRPGLRPPGKRRRSSSAQLTPPPKESTPQWQLLPVRAGQLWPSLSKIDPSTWPGAMARPGGIQTRPKRRRFPTTS